MRDGFLHQRDAPYVGGGSSGSSTSVPSGDRSQSAPPREPNFEDDLDSGGVHFMHDRSPAPYSWRPSGRCVERPSQQFEYQECGTDFPAASSRIFEARARRPPQKTSMEHPAAHRVYHDPFADAYGYQESAERPAACFRHRDTFAEQRATDFEGEGAFDERTSARYGYHEAFAEGSAGGFRYQESFRERPGLHYGFERPAAHRGYERPTMHSEYERSAHYGYQRAANNRGTYADRPTHFGDGSHYTNGFNQSASAAWASGEPRQQHRGNRASAQREGTATQRQVWVPPPPPPPSDDPLTMFISVLDEYHPSKLVGWLQRRTTMLEDAPPPPAEYDEDLYEALQVRPDATAAEIRKAYRQLALRTHPDKPTGDRALFQRVARAYSVLSDNLRRDDYDRKRLAGPLPRPARIVLRSSRDVAGDVAKDLEQAGNTIGKAAQQLWASLRAAPGAAAAGLKPQQPAAPGCITSTVKAKCGGASGESNKPRVGTAPGMSGADFL